MDDIIIPVPHIKQKFDWDCGLACIEMVLRYFKVEHGDLDSFVRSLYCASSVWTVDLAQILAHYKLKHLFTTIYQGVNKDYKDKCFYRNHFTRDEIRVNAVFQNVNEIGINVKEKSVPLNVIIHHLVYEKAPIILLVDWSKFISKCPHCSNHYSTRHLRLLSKCFQSSNSYLGHFIVLCGFSEAKNSFYYNNPDVSKPGYCLCGPKELDVARVSDGTDEDIIFLFNHI